MTLNLNPVDRMIAKCQTVNSLIRRLKKLTHDLEDPKLSRESRRHRFSAIQLASESLELQRHELHCEAVALGIADPQARRYGAKTIATAYGTAILFFRYPNEDPILTADPGPQQPTPLELQIQQAGEMVTKAAETIKEHYDSEIIIPTTLAEWKESIDRIDPVNLGEWIENRDEELEVEKFRMDNGMENDYSHLSEVIEYARSRFVELFPPTFIKEVEPSEPNKRKNRRKNEKPSPADPELPENIPLNEDGLPVGMEPTSVI